jgi:hypothetical protein
MSLTEAQTADFAVYARRPATWLEGSRRHLAVYKVLSHQFDRLNMQAGRSQDEFSGCFYAAYLHAGLAVENGVTAFLVAEDPTIIKDGRIDRKKLGDRAGHRFATLAERILGSLSQSQREVLLKLEEYVVWAGKYTVPMNAEMLYDHARMNVLRSAPMNERELILDLVARLLQSQVA